MAEIRLRPWQFKGSSNEKSDGKWYPRVQHYSVIRADELARMAAEDSRIEQYEVQYVISAVVKQIEELVFQGHSIIVPELGTFSLAADTRTVETWDEVRTDRLIRQFKLNFRADKSLTSALKNASVRMEKPFSQKG